MASRQARNVTQLSVRAALNQHAALVSRIRHWDPPPIELHMGLLEMMDSTVQLKLSWVWHADGGQETSTSQAGTSSCQFLLVQDGIRDRIPCYESDSEEGSWEITWPAKASAPATPSLVVVKIPSGEADVICLPAGEFCSNCCHAFQLRGRAHVLCGANSSSQDQLTNRIGVYSLGDLWLLSPGPESNMTTFEWVEFFHWPDADNPDPMYVEPEWQRQETWQTGAKSASVAGHGSLVAWQTGRCRLTVIDMSSYTEVAHVSLDAVALPDSDIDGLQWSSSGDHLAIQCRNADRAQLMLVETCSWQHVACREYGTGLSIHWAPSKPSLAILDGSQVEVGCSSACLSSHRVLERPPPRDGINATKVVFAGWVDTVFDDIAWPWWCLLPLPAVLKKALHINLCMGLAFEAAGQEPSISDKDSHTYMIDTHDHTHAALHSSLGWTAIAHLIVFLTIHLMRIVACLS